MEATSICNLTPLTLRKRVALKQAWDGYPARAISTHGQGSPSLFNMSGLLASLAKFSVSQPEKAALSFLDDQGGVKSSLSYEELR